MPSLGDVMGALLTQIARGRSQADAATLEVARIYKEQPLLTDFPVPRFTVEEIVVDLKVGIAAAPAPERVLAAPARAEVAGKLQKLFGLLGAAEPSLKTILEASPETAQAWRESQAEITDRAMEMIPAEGEVDPKRVAQSAAALVRAHVSRAALMPEGRPRLEVARDFIVREAARVEGRVAQQIEDILRESLKAQPAAKDRFDVMVTASELQTIPPEKITTLRITLKESDRTWTQYETEKGEVREKLIPG